MGDKMKNEKSCGAIVELNGKILLIQQKNLEIMDFLRGIFYQEKVR